MTTYKGGEIPVPDRLDEDLRLVGARLPGMENVEEELNLPPEAGSDMLRRPGMKGYMETEPMADVPGTPDDPYLLRYRLDQMEVARDRAKGRPVQTQDPMPPDQRKLADRINVNELMQAQDDARYLGRGTSRDTMPPPPTTDNFAGGGMVKHGSSTRVTCKSKHGG